MWIRPARKKPRTLVAERSYFGFDPETFQQGVQRLVARLGAAPGAAQVSASILSEDFAIDLGAADALLRAFAAGGLVRSDKAGRYRATERLRVYATAKVVAPLRRARARLLISEAAARAGRINAEWRRNPLVIDAIAVSGSYMSRHDKLTELTLWLVVRPRPQVKTRRARQTGDLAARRQIITAMCALSSFVVVHVVAEREAVQRPFSIVFQASDDDALEAPRWSRWRDWTLSLSRRLSGRSRRAA